MTDRLIELLCYVERKDISIYDLDDHIEVCITIGDDEYSLVIDKERSVYEHFQKPQV